MSATPRATKQPSLSREATADAVASGKPWLEFTVPGNPKPKERPRIARNAYTPSATMAAEREIAWSARQALRSQKPATVPLMVELDFYRETAHRCDIDNLAKTVLDALNRFAWDDDSQIERLTLTKSVDRVSPRTVVRVYLAASF